MGPLDLDLIIKLSVLLYLGSSNLKMFKIAIFFVCFFSNGQKHRATQMKITVLTPLLMYVSLSLISMKLEIFQGTSVGDTYKNGVY
jgi:hypothetical protein